MSNATFTFKLYSWTFYYKSAWTKRKYFYTFHEVTDTMNIMLWTHNNGL